MQRESHETSAPYNQGSNLDIHDHETNHEPRQRPPLKRVEKMHSIQQPKTAEQAPWTQHSLRKVSREHAHQHSSGTPDVSVWKDKLKKVEKPAGQDSIKTTTPPAATWRRSLSKTPHRGPSTTGRRSACIFCHPSQASSSPKTDLPCLTVEDEASGRRGHLVTSRDNVEHGHSVHTQEWVEESLPPSKLRLKQVEHTLARDNADDRLRRESNQTALGDAYTRELRTHTNRSSQLNRSSCEQTEVIAKHYGPRPSRSSDHACIWRARYMDLSSEVEHMKSDMSSHDEGSREVMAPRPSNHDVGVGDAMAQHHCEGLGLQGLTIVMHMKDKDDLVINTDLTREGSEVD